MLHDPDKIPVPEITEEQLITGILKFTPCNWVIENHLFVHLCYREIKGKMQWDIDRLGAYNLFELMDIFESAKAQFDEEGNLL